MSLLQEARQGIRRQRYDERIAAEARERMTQELKDLILLRREQAGVAEERKRRDLQSEIRSECTELLVQHGVKVPDFSERIFGSIFRSIWYSQGRELSTTIGEDGEEPVRISIKSEFLRPAKGKISVQAQGSDTYLDLPRNGQGFLRLIDGRSARGANFEDLSKYKEVIDLVKGKFQLAAPVQTPR